MRKYDLIVYRNLVTLPKIILSCVTNLIGVEMYYLVLEY